MKNYKKGFTPILIAIGVVFIIVVVGTITYVVKKNNVTQQKISVEVNHNDKNVSKFYKAEIKKLNNDTNLFELYSTYSLHEMFGLKKIPDTTPQIIFDIRNGNPLEGTYKGDYFIGLDPRNSKSLESKTYNDKNFAVTITPINDKLIPYFERTRTYCELDTDCSIGGYFCSTGVYNNYRNISIYGCEQGDSSITEQDEMKCNLNAQHPVVKYATPKCLQNKCVAQTRTITCENGSYSQTAGE